MTNTVEDFVHVACAHCATENRIAGTRLGEGPKCGKCSEPLLPGKPVELSDATYETVIARIQLAAAQRVAGGQYVAGLAHLLEDLLQEHGLELFADRLELLAPRRARAFVAPAQAGQVLG